MENVIESYVSRAAIVVWLLWGMTVLLAVGGWTVDLMLPVESHLGRMFETTGGTVACMAAVAHIRVYAIRACALIRATSGLEPEEPRRLESVR